ncbi:MAG: hypothetical protein H6R13_2527 [Proteobacteria bacterium]|nr:hypothetical protein [Pseudomonadota bacterium]
MNPIKSVVLLGPTPPPAGGVSIHIKRFAYRLNYLGWPVHILSTTAQHDDGNTIAIGNNRIFGILSHYKRFRGNLVLVHSSELYGLVVSVYCKLAGAQVVQYFHNGRALARIHRNPLLGWLVGKVLGYLDQVFVVNAEIAKSVHHLSNGVAKIDVVNPFIPPLESELQGYIPTGFESGKRIYVGWCGLFSGERAAIYGLDFFASVFRRFVSAGHDAVAVLAAADFDAENELQTMARMKCLFANRVVIVPSDVPFVSVLNVLDIFIRPTATDGDSISVREALYLNLPVLASDVSLRPSGVSTYRFGDEDQCFQLLEKLIESNPGSARVSPPSASPGCEAVLPGDINPDRIKQMIRSFQD